MAAGPKELCNADCPSKQAPGSPDSLSTRLTITSQSVLEAGRQQSSSGASGSGSILGSEQSAFTLPEVRAKDEAVDCFPADYELTERVFGTGVSGSVREAICRTSGRSVAVKSLAVDSDLSGTRARREASLHGELDHPHIVKVEGSYDAGDVVHMVMERLEGGELLRRILEVQGLPELEAAKVTIQLLRAVGYLHARGVVHRDLKPENVVYVAKGGSLVKVVDFGFALRRRPGQRLRQNCGTVKYTAPEVVSGAGYDEKADIWSLGAVVHAMLVTRPPCPRADAPEAGDLDFDALKKSAASEGAQDFVQSLLAPDAAQRPSAVQALAHPWLLAQAGEEAEAAKREVEEGFSVARRQAPIASGAVSCFSAFLPQCALEILAAAVAELRALSAVGKGVPL